MSVPLEFWRDLTPRICETNTHNFTWFHKLIYWQVTCTLRFHKNLICLGRNRPIFILRGFSIYPRLGDIWLSIMISPFTQQANRPQDLGKTFTVRVKRNFGFRAIQNSCINVIPLPSVTFNRQMKAFEIRTEVWIDSGMSRKPRS